MLKRTSHNVNQQKNALSKDHHPASIKDPVSSVLFQSSSSDVYIGFSVVDSTGCCKVCIAWSVQWYSHTRQRGSLVYVVELQFYTCAFNRINSCPLCLQLIVLAHQSV